MKHKKNKLYKYRSLKVAYDNTGKIIYDGIERCVDIIENNRLYFPIRETLNDPYEGIATPIKLGICGEGIFTSMGLNHPIVEAKLNEYRILSLSRNPLSMQMWAHYADNYEGICFEFGTTGIFGKASRVHYIDKPFAPIYEPYGAEFDNIIKKSFFYKSKHWQYEDEYRIVDKSSDEYVNFNRTDLIGIIIGRKAIYRKDVQEKIIALAKCKHIPVYYTLFTPKEYKLSIVCIEDVSDLGTQTLEQIRYL